MSAVPGSPPACSPATPAAGSDAQEPAPATDWRRLPDLTLRAWHVDNVIGLVIGLALLGALATLGRPLFVQPWLLPAAALALIAAVVESAVVLPRRHARYRYRVTARSVVVESGLLFFHQLVVPLHQVLFVEMHQGPVLRAFGLTRIRLGTIADPKSIGPLTREAAELLRAAVEAARPPTDGSDRFG